jgi:cytosine/adenosine deaminase-related metal-dependent hydrolase
MTAGVSPHATYTVSFELLEAACRWAGRVHAPLAFHFAESPEERELLESGHGPFEDLLRGANVWREGQFGHRQPIEYLRPLTRCARVALIHGNYLREAERQFLADHRQRISVVYCPRTHEYFGHEPYPLNDYLEQGISVAIGTDSRASSPNLSLLEEILAARRLHPEVAPDKLLEMVTTRAAEAIGLGECGSLQIGKPCEFVEIPVDRKIADPYEALFDGISTK